MVPHTWNGEEWTCTGCGHVSLDPCDCACHVGEHKHRYEWLEVFPETSGWFCRCGAPLDEDAWVATKAEGVAMAERLGIPVVTLCDNPLHPRGAGHPASPEPKGLWARFVQNCRVQTWGCTCKA